MSSWAFCRATPVGLSRRTERHVRNNSRGAPQSRSLARNHADGWCREPASRRLQDQGKSRPPRGEKSPTCCCLRSRLPSEHMAAAPQRSSTPTRCLQFKVRRSRRLQDQGKSRLPRGERSPTCCCLTSRLLSEHFVAAPQRSSKAPRLRR
jgi:hypothetical protein